MPGRRETNRPQAMQKCVACGETVNMSSRAGLAHMQEHERKGEVKQVAGLFDRSQKYSISMRGWEKVEITKLHPYDMYDLIQATYAAGKGDTIKDLGGPTIEIDGKRYAHDSSMPYKSTTFGTEADVKVEGTFKRIPADEAIS